MLRLSPADELHSFFTSSDCGADSLRLIRKGSEDAAGYAET
jgi:hypothetical protein